MLNILFYISLSHSFIGDGHISWGRISALFMFAYHLAVSRLHKGVTKVLSKVILYLVKFLRVHRVFHWIGQQGGWTAVLNYVPDNGSNLAVGLAIGLSLAFIGIRYFFH